LILHFQIFANQDLEETSAAKRTRESKTKLLEWCKEQTKGYNHINIEDFQDSWFDGLAFCALVNKFDPSLLDYHTLTTGDKQANLQKAFKIAEEKMGIPALIEAEDVVQDDRNLIPNEQCFITYISQFPVAFLDKVTHDKDLEADQKVKDAERKLREEEEERRRLEEERRRLEEERRRLEDEERRNAEEEKKREEEEKKRLEEEKIKAEKRRRKKEEKDKKKKNKPNWMRRRGRKWKRRRERETPRNTILRRKERNWRKKIKD